jgi:non-ribosomal peptide synthetase component F
MQTKTGETSPYPDLSISESAMPNLAEHGQVPAERNRTEPEYAKEKCIHELFAEEAERNPDAVAVVYEDRAMSYRELKERSSQLAHCLRGSGVEPETLVAVCLERSPELIVGILGILKAGGAYVPMDPSYPKERLAFMLEDTRAPVLLTNRSLQAGLPTTNTTTIYLDGNFESIDRQCISAPANLVTPANLAYVIYTSGSTGKPKGVLIEHAGMVNLVGEHHKHYPTKETKEGIRVSQITNAGFDAMGSETWPALLSGATHCIGHVMK